MQNLTRSGRVFKPDELVADKGKAAIDVDVPVKIFTAREPSGTKNGGITMDEEMVKRKEAERRKVKKHMLEKKNQPKKDSPEVPSRVNADSVLEQLKRTKVDVSIWDLIVA